MNNKQGQPPILAKLILHMMLPDNIRNDICGDLEEEYHQFIKVEQGEMMANRWFWQQSLVTCFRYVFTKQRLLSLLTMGVACSLFIGLYVAVTILSFGTIELFKADYWENGNVHFLFADARFWYYMSETNFQSIGLKHLIDLKAIVFSLSALFLLLGLNKCYQLRAATFVILSYALMFSPYLYGVFSFNFTTLDRQSIGPLIAFMWLPIMYMVLPLSYIAILKLNNSSAVLKQQ